MRISSQVMGQKRVSGRTCHLRMALSSTVRPAACIATVTATRTHALRMIKSIGWLMDWIAPVAFVESGFSFWEEEREGEA